jgi:hypothetical protein
MTAKICAEVTVRVVQGVDTTMFFATVQTVGAVPCNASGPRELPEATLDAALKRAERLLREQLKESV